MNMPEGKVELKGLLPEELEGFAQSLGEAPYRGRQLFSWIHKRLSDSFEEMSDLPRELRQRLDAIAYIFRLTLIRSMEDRQGTVKFLFGLPDGQAIECVNMTYRYGTSVCVSSQVGCKMGCEICASGMSGFVRDLSVSEIVDQVLFSQRRAKERGGRVSHIVFMGSGEPLENYDAVLKAIRLFGSPLGLGMSPRRITVSTCGLVPGIRRLAGEGLPLTLSVSLHASNDRVRDRLMPINRVYPIGELLRACDYYAEMSARRITFEYCIIEGVNDSDKDAIELARMLAGRLAHVNLIPFNPVWGKPFRRPSRERTLRFRDELLSRHIPVTVRRELGLGLDAACGQLRRRFIGGGGRESGISGEDRGVSRSYD